MTTLYNIVELKNRKSEEMYILEHAVEVVFGGEGMSYHIISVKLCHWPLLFIENNGRDQTVQQPNKTTRRY